MSRKPTKTPATPDAPVEPVEPAAPVEPEAPATTEITLLDRLSDLVTPQDSESGISALFRTLDDYRCTAKALGLPAGHSLYNRVMWDAENAAKYLAKAEHLGAVVTRIGVLTKLRSGEDVVMATERVVESVKVASQASSTHFVFNQDVVNPPAPVEVPLPAPSLSDTDDLFIRRTLGSLLGMGPNEATAASMASMLSKKLRAR